MPLRELPHNERSMATFPLSDTLTLSIVAASGGHLVQVRTEEKELVQATVPDLQRLLKRPGTVFASAPLEMRNDHRLITVSYRGRVLGTVEKHGIVAVLHESGELGGH